MTKKKRFTFKDAKAKIAELEELLSAANVKLDDNIVTKEELKWLKLYKAGFYVFGVVILLLLAL